MSIHDMQIAMHQDASILSRSLSESDLSEIAGGATNSNTVSPVQMLAPSDDENINLTGKTVFIYVVILALGAVKNRALIVAPLLFV